MALALIHEAPLGHREAGRQRRVGDRLHDLAGARALHGEHRPALVGVGDLGVELAIVIGERAAN